MISWGAVLALMGFQYSAVDRSLAFAAGEGVQFWSNGFAYGTITQKRAGPALSVTVEAVKGELSLKSYEATGFGKSTFPAVRTAAPRKLLTFEVKADPKGRGSIPRS
jgi:non-lysosomal glucosylceramidase